MDARCAEIYSMASNAKMNLHTFSIAYKHAISSGLADNEFETVTIPILELYQKTKVQATSVRCILENKEAVDDFERVIPELEKKANNAYVNSQIVVQQIQEAVAAAAERKKAREEEAKGYEAEEPATKKARNKP